MKEVKVFSLSGAGALSCPAPYPAFQTFKVGLLGIQTFHKNTQENRRVIFAKVFLSLSDSGPLACSLTQHFVELGHNSEIADAGMWNAVCTHELYLIIDAK